jgi:hypothetical protein
VQFYAATEGREAAALVALSLGGTISPLPAPNAPTEITVAELVPLHESALALAGTLLIATLGSQAGEVDLGAVEPEALAAVSASSAVPLTAGQGVPVQALGGDTNGGGHEPAAERDGTAAGMPAPASGPSWQRLILGTDQALERFNSQHPELFPSGRDDGRETSPTGGQSPAPTQPVAPPGQSPSPRAERRLEAIDRAIELSDGPDGVALERSSGGERRVAVALGWRGAATGSIARLAFPNPPVRLGTGIVSAQSFRKPGPAPTARYAEHRPHLSAMLAMAATLSGAIGIPTVDRRARKRAFPTGSRG